MSDVENILQFYFMSNKLKNTLRTGWKYWSVEGVRVESIAEHIYGTLMLAVSICAHTTLEIDIERVALMLALHETEEILIGDITIYDGERYETKKEEGHKAVCALFNDSKKDLFLEVIDEFEKGETKEAKFAYMCDKLEADLQAFLYKDHFNLENANKTCLENGDILAMIDKGFRRPDQFFLQNDKEKFEGIFRKIADYLQELED